ncbi:uncharacterized protein MELLADRAFT_111832 [Melampsora larici-populina 98AG31]|uniref:Uncharacterized protein n=1 Tax=Melampsora larici-populina (strain 98AG31 / pathotype 3-4-7) TaxID=747676 RepID=F4S4H7_MELLP|nr:uncharacterized protein MELLADRAFT_111832 [Melampsora larici-populina 98AG31]EGG00412.1 hypothetical protein MELLADRAFT_111832 [Melampsora larici-populina 98AG31]
MRLMALVQRVTSQQVWRNEKHMNHYWQMGIEFSESKSAETTNKDAGAGSLNRDRALLGHSSRLFCAVKQCRGWGLVSYIRRPGTVKRLRKPLYEVRQFLMIPPAPQAHSTTSSARGLRTFMSLYASLEFTNQELTVCATRHGGKFSDSRAAEAEKEICHVAWWALGLHLPGCPQIPASLIIGIVKQGDAYTGSFRLSS